MRETWDLMILSCCVCCCSYGGACRELRRCWLLWVSSGRSCSARTSPTSSFWTGSTIWSWACVHSNCGTCRTLGSTSSSLRLPSPLSTPWCSSSLFLWSMADPFSSIHSTETSKTMWTHSRDNSFFFQVASGILLFLGLGTGATTLIPMPSNNRKSSGPAIHLYCISSISDLMVAASFVGMRLDLNGLLFFVVLLRWDRRTAAVVPDEEVFYLVAFLRNALPSGPGLQSMLDENARILRVCEDLNGKHYLPRYTEEEQWKRHFGSEKWTAFVQHKHMFDPHAILAPGQNIFPRNQNPLDQLLLHSSAWWFLLVYTAPRMSDAFKT